MDQRRRMGAALSIRFSGGFADPGLSITGHVTGHYDALAIPEFQH
jgi:hypothetical protein